MQKNEEIVEGVYCGIKMGTPMQHSHAANTNHLNELILKTSAEFSVQHQQM